MHTASSARRTCNAPRSASEYTATVRSPRRRAVRITRQAISPRLAMRRDVIILITNPWSHSEDAVRLLALVRPAGRRRERQREHLPRVDGIDDTVVPQSRARIGRVPLRLVLRADLVAEAALVFLRPGLAATLQAFAADDREHRCGLLAAHHGDPRVGPGPQEATAVGSTAHRVIARPERAADDHGQLG